MAGEELRNPEDVAAEETVLEISPASEKHADEVSLMKIFTVQFFISKEAHFVSECSV